MGVVLTLQRRWSGSLTQSIVTHWTYNFTLVSIGLLTYPGTE